MKLDFGYLRNPFEIRLAFSLMIISFYSTFTNGVSKFQIPSLEGCAIIGAPNATINDCGYCVGGESSLTNDYGKDCKGECFGNAVIDCNDVCGGDAYVDECTGICITADLLRKNAVNVTLNRDCRGMCIPAELSRPQQQAYDKDECGYCRLQSSDKSQFIDCNANCYLPGTSGASLVCGQCVQQNEAHSVLDECGNCRQKDTYFCGCSDPNICHKAKSLTPKSIPLSVASNILVSGYFHPTVRDLYCLLQHQSSRDIKAFPVSFIPKNKTTITCTVNLEKGGYYNFVIGFQRNMFNAFNANEAIKLYAYDSFKVVINNIEPTSVSTTDYYKPVDIRFSVEQNSLPQMPLKCIVRYSDSTTEYANESNQPFSCSLPPTKRRAKHQTLTVYPSFDGNTTISQHGFELTVDEPLPKLSQQNCYISEDGLAIVIKFDNPVITRSKHNSTQSDCDYLLSAQTISELSHYTIEDCLWAASDQLIIYTRQSIVTNKVNVKFNKNIFTVNRLNHQLNDTELEVSATKLSWSWWRYEPMVAITGPSEIPVCGSFALSGHFSSPRGTNEVYFRWDVMGDISAELKEYVEENGKSTNLLLSAEFFEIHVPYKFIFKAYITERDQTLETGHTLIRLDYDSPIVSIYHTALLQLTPLHVNQEMLFVADYSVPECVFPVQKVNILWKVVDPRILFPLKNSTEDIATRHSLTYKLTPFTVPVDQTVGIFLNAYFGFRFNETSGAGFTFSASAAPLVANIANGCHKMTIGSSSGLFTIESGSAKYEQNRSLVYQWSCHDIKTAQPCYYNFGDNAVENNAKTRDPLLIDRSLQNRRTLELNSSSLEVNKNFAFGLQVFDANDHTSASQTEYVFVNVIDGNAPQVYVGPVYVKGKHLTSNNPQFNATIVVPARTAITIKGIVRPAKNVHFKWEAINSVHKLNWKYKYANDEIHTELNLHENHIIPFGEYVVKLIACNNNNNLCSDADISLIAPQGVTNCKLTVDSFTEYELTIANIQECNTPAGYAPLTYQLYLVDENSPNLIPLTVPQYHNVLTFAGISSSSSKENARFAAQVCDKFSVCSVYYSPTVTLQRSTNETASISELIKLAKRQNTAGDSIAALSVLSTIFVKNDLIVDNNLTEKAINDTIEYSTQALIKPSQPLSDGHIAVAYNVLSGALRKTDNNHLKRRLLANIINFSRKSFAWKVLPKVQTIKSVYSNLMLYFKKAVEEKRFGLLVENIQLLRDIRRSFKEIRRSAAAQIQFGTEMTLTSESETDISDGTKVYNAITKLIHSDKINNIHISAKLNKETEVEAVITFGEEVRNLYRNGWDCGQQTLCYSVVYTVTLYPNDNPYLNLDESHQLTPVIDVTIHAPNTGEEQEIKGFLQAATFKITLIGNETYGGPDYHTLCFYYDEEEEIWKKDDVHPLGIAFKNASCLTGHLTAFVVLRIVLGFSFNYVIGIVVAVVMGVLVFAIMVALFVQRKKDDDNQESSPVSQPIPVKHNRNAKKVVPLNSNRLQHERHLALHTTEVVT